MNPSLARSPWCPDKGLTAYPVNATGVHMLGLGAQRGPTAYQQVRALLGHVRIETTQVNAYIQPAQLKESVSFYEGKAVDALT